MGNTILGNRPNNQSNSAEIHCSSGTSDSDHITFVYDDSFIIVTVYFQEPGNGSYITSTVIINPKISGSSIQISPPPSNYNYSINLQVYSPYIAFNIFNSGITWWAAIEISTQ